MKDILESASQLEKYLDSITVKLPKLPKEIVEVLVKVMPWLAVLGIVGSIFVAWGFLSLIFFPNVLVNGYGMYITNEPTGTYLLKLWIQIAIYAVTVFCLVKWIRGLFDKKRVGWQWAYYAQIVTVIGSVLVLDIGALIGEAIGLYLLFQVKEAFKAV